MISKTLRKIIKKKTVLILTFGICAVVKSSKGIERSDDTCIYRYEKALHSVISELKNGPAEKGEPVSKENKDSLTLTKKKLSRQYRNWLSTIRNYYPVSNEASDKEMTSSSDDIQQRVLYYNIAFPGLSPRNKDVEREIIIEKYLREETGIIPSDLKVQTCYNDFIRNSPLYPPPIFEKIIPLIRCRALLLDDSARAFCAHLRMEQNKRQAENNKKENELWPIDEITLDADSQTCLVVDPETDECLITVKKLNTFLAIHPERKKMRLDTARIRALREMLKSYYLAELARTNRIHENDTLLESEERNLTRRLLIRTIMNEAISEQDETLLIQLYEKYYNLYFKRKIIRQIALIGSTDSLYIDSLIRNIRIFDTLTIDTNYVLKRRFLKSLPWIYLTNDLLPETLNAAVDTLKSQQYIRVANSFGHFICRTIASNQTRETDFQGAQSILLYLLFEERKRYNTIPDSAYFYNHYTKHISRYVTPDTLLGRFWLVPLDSLQDTMSMSDMQKRLSSDTADYDYINVRSDKLPKEITDSLLRIYSKCDKKITLIGPVVSSFGIWYYQIHNHIDGGEQLSFNSVRNDISDEFLIKQLPFDSIFSTKAGTVIREVKVLASAYRKQMFKEINDLSEKNILNYFCNDLNISNNDYKHTMDEKMLSSAKMKIWDLKVEEEQRAIFNWIASLDINRDILFIGCSDLTGNLE